MRHASVRSAVHGRTCVTACSVSLIKRRVARGLRSHGGTRTTHVARRRREEMMSYDAPLRRVSAALLQSRPVVPKTPILRGQSNSVKRRKRIGKPPTQTPVRCSTIRTFVFLGRFTDNQKTTPLGTTT